mgnify:CR=1 FL=1
MIYEQIISEHQRLEREISSLKKRINELPEGKLICARSGKYTKWYHSDGHHPTYLPKEKLDKRLA